MITSDNFQFDVIDCFEVNSQNDSPVERHLD